MRFYLYSTEYVDYIIVPSPNWEGILSIDLVCLSVRLSVAYCLSLVILMAQKMLLSNGAENYQKLPDTKMPKIFKTFKTAQFYLILPKNQKRPKQIGQ